MSALIVHSIEPVLLVGAAQLGTKDINILQSDAPIVVAADGGADHILAENMAPVAVIGDLDSLSATARAKFTDILHPIDEESTTDFEKAIVRIDAPLVLALGFLGGRIDHTLATLNVMARYHSRPIIAINHDDVCFVITAPLTLDLPTGTRLSMMPLAEVHVRTTGLRWEVDEVYHPAAAVSASNEVAGPVGISVNGPLLIVLPRAQLPVAIAAVRGR